MRIVTELFPSQRHRRGQLLGHHLHHRHGGHHRVALTVSATGVNRVYDGTTSATVTLSNNRDSGDSLSTSYTSASFADKNIGTAKTVDVSGITISGTDVANYQLSSGSATTTANITAKGLTVTGITASNKV